MNKGTLAALVLAAAPAAAQPVTRPDSCGATIAYAPDDVRAIVEDAVRQETSCNVTLEVRIVPTDGGLYLFARDEQGRVRERLVPDAQSASVLIASWMVDDSRPPEPPPIAVFPAHASEVPRLNAVGEQIDAPTPVAEQAQRKRDIVIGAGPLFGGGRSQGGRVEVDALTWHGFTFGGALTVDAGETTAFESSIYDPWLQMDVVDTSATAHVAVQFRLGNWVFRPAFGLGFTYTRAREKMEVPHSDPWADPDYEVHDSAGVVTTREMTVALGYRFREWQLDIGPYVAWYGSAPGGKERLPGGNFFAALRYRL